MIPNTPPSALPVPLESSVASSVPQTASPQGFTPLRHASRHDLLHATSSPRNRRVLFLPWPRRAGESAKPARPDTWGEPAARRARARARSSTDDGGHPFTTPTI
jgi:hypothetical protein